MSGLLGQGSVDVGKRAAKAGGVGQKGETGAAEDAGEPVLPVGIDDQPRRRASRTAMWLSSMPWVPS